MTERGQFVLPIGTVTLLLADIEGSTRGWEERPTEMAPALARLHEAVDTAVAGHEGVRPVEQGEGDSFVAAFSRASDALACALEIQRRLAGSALRLRIGIHTGEVQLGNEGSYVGPAINRAARLRDAAHGGQVVLSHVSHGLVQDRLPDDTVTRDLGLHRLRDLGRPEHVFQLLHPDLDEDFPPLRSLDHAPNNLPVQLTSFVGREPELAVLAKLLTDARMVTLTGAGGCGKTRLAVELAARVLDRHPDGVWFVDLAPVSDPKAIPSAVAAALGLREQQGRRLLDTLLDQVRAQRALLVLDNCEHLVDASAQLAHQVLVACPDVSVLATSREQLGVTGETAWLVPSLSVPDRRPLPRIQALGQYEAVQLFVDRARQARPNFSVTNDTAPAVAAICQRLDGIPLAIELAAARTRVLSPQQILDGLDDRFRLLTGGGRTAAARQQTLRASVDWSYELLSEAERLLLARLSVFAGGFSLDAAEAVAGGDPIGALAVLDILQGLADKSLVLVGDPQGTPRYRMLETIRQYALEQLTASDEHETVRERHCRYYVDLAERAEPGLEGGEQEQWANQLEAERQNLRAAIDWAHSRGNAEASLRLVAAVFWFWVIRGHLGEGSRLCRIALEVREGAPDDVHARALVAACHIGWFRSDFSLAPLAPEALALARRAGDRKTEGRALYHVALLGDMVDRKVRAAEAEASVDIAREVGDRWGLALSLVLTATVFRESRARARPLLDEAVTVCEELGERYILNTARYNLAGARLDNGRTLESETMLRQVVAHARTTGDTFSLTMALADLGLLRALQGEIEEGIAILEEDRQLFESHRLPWIGIALQCHGILSGVLLMAGRNEEARAVAERAVALSRDLQPALTDRFDAGSMADLAAALQALGEEAEAKTLIDESLSIVEGIGTWVEGSVKDVAARVALARGDREDAARLAGAALALSARIGNHYWGNGTVYSLETCALVADDPNQAARLLAAVDTLLAEAHHVRAPASRPAYDAAIVRLRTELGDEAFEEARREGSRLSLEEAVAYARRGQGQRRRPSSGWDSLTPTENEVVKLVAQGLSNPKIAERLFISKKTVTTHLTHVFAKLGMSSRAELSAEAARRGM